MAERYLRYGLGPVDEEQMLIFLVTCAGYVMQWFEQLGMSEQIPRAVRDASRGTYLRRMLEENDINCVNMLRMRRALFFNLCSILRGRGLLNDTINTSVEEQVAMFLHTVGYDQRNRVVSLNFMRSGETISRQFHRVLRAIGELKEDYILEPSTALHEYIASNERFWPYFKDCVGAIDGTHIQACLPVNEVIPFYGRHDYPSQNVLAVVDFDTRFIYVLAGWEGSAHDATVLRDALERPNGFRVPEGYTTKPGFIALYRSVRYHMSDYRNNSEPANYKELFNYRHSSLRMTVERAFGILKGRFKILACQHFFPFATQVNLVIVCCILHNYILGHGSDELHVEEDEWNAQNLSQVGKTRAQMREESNMWVELREQIALQMWADEHPLS